MERTSGPSILVLDDDDGFCLVLARALTRAGYSVVDTGNANDAITLLSSAAVFDLLIADIKMPNRQPHGIAVGNIARLKQRRMGIIYHLWRSRPSAERLHRCCRDAVARQAVRSEDAAVYRQDGARGAQVAAWPIRRGRQAAPALVEMNGVGNSQPKLNSSGAIHARPALTRVAPMRGMYAAALPTCGDQFQCASFSMSSAPSSPC